MTTFTPFKNHFEFFQHLVNKGEVVHKNYLHIPITVDEDGYFRFYKGSRIPSILLHDFGSFQPYTSPRWEDLLAEGIDVWCFVSDKSVSNLTEHSCASIAKINVYRPDSDSPYCSRSLGFFKYAKPVLDNINQSIKQELKDVGL